MSGSAEDAQGFRFPVQKSGPGLGFHPIPYKQESWTSMPEISLAQGMTLCPSSCSLAGFKKLLSEKKKQQTTNQSEIWFEFWVVVCRPRSRTQWSLGIPSSSGHSVTYDNLGTERDVENFPKKLWFPKGNYCLYATLLVSLLILLLCENICQAMILAAHVFSAAGGR